MGPDASWYPDLGAAFVESMAYNEDAEHVVGGNGG